MEDAPSAAALAKLKSAVLRWYAMLSNWAWENMFEDLSADG